MTIAAVLQGKGSAIETIAANASLMDAVQRQTVCDRFGRTARDVLILGDLDPERITSRGIEDPVEQSEEVCRRVYARIERCVAELVKVWWSAPAARRA